MSVLLSPTGSTISSLTSPSGTASGRSGGLGGGVHLGSFGVFPDFFATSSVESMRPLAMMQVTQAPLELLPGPYFLSAPEAVESGAMLLVQVPLLPNQESPGLSELGTLAARSSNPFLRERTNKEAQICGCCGVSPGSECLPAGDCAAMLCVFSICKTVDQ